ncbi:MAG: oxygen-independent coproporphyrinogen III oxidase [Alphaproteobacteria bacterium]|nr:oxygen-independent coproporphyrinogen III oxidase [Alphaproteobacteria bacterium]
MDRRDLISRYDRRVPRYTSYPTALQFHPIAGDGWYRDWLGGIPQDMEVSLYLHVPFCRAMCWYCGCHTRVAKDEQPVQSYVAALRREIALVAGAIGRRLAVCRVHWGGGTPTLLSPATFAAIFEDLSRHFDISTTVEHAVEADPRTLTDGLADALAAAGVTRVSLGVQTLSDAVQRRINRLQPFDQVAAAVGRLRRVGIGNLNFDLMYGLPGQATGDVVATAEAVAGLSPSRLALFGYAHVPWMKPHQKRIEESELPDAGGRFEQLLAGAEALERSGYHRIGLDHFARPSDSLARAAAEGRLRRNFQGYTDDPSPVLIGLGASAIGQMPDGYAQNVVAIPDWEREVFAGRLPVAKMRGLSPEDALRGEVIERLMCGLVVDLVPLLDAHGYPPTFLDDSLRILEEAAGDGLVEVDGRRIRVTETGWPFLRSIAAAFDAYLAPAESRHARAV